VNRRFRMPPSDESTDDEEPEHEDQTDTPARVAVPVGVGAGARPSPAALTDPRRSIASGNGSPGRNGDVDDGFGDDDGEWEEDDDETEVRRLRRSVAAELVIALVVLSITALLVNAAPARSVQTAPISMTLKSSQVWVDVVIAPGVAGGNDIHLTSLPVGDTVTNVEDMSVQLTRPGSDLPPFNVQPLIKLGPGHYVASLYNIPFPGEWQMTIRVRLGETDEAVLTGKFTLR
jgi:hypothetical protein